MLLRAPCGTAPEVTEFNQTLFLIPSFELLSLEVQGRLDESLAELYLNGPVQKI